MGFLISTPQTGVDAIVVSAAFLGWPFALFKIAVAAVTGIFGGLLADFVADDDPKNDDSPAAPAATRRSIGAVVGHSIEVIRSVWLWLVIGIVVSAAIEVWLPASIIGQINTTGGSLLSAIVALAISLPMYVCATSSVPIAAALVAKGLPIGAALVFLMAGPATNVATIGAIYRTFGFRLMAVYLGTIIFGSFSAAMAFDWFAPTTQLVELGTPHQHSPLWSAFSFVCALLLSGMFAWFTVDESRHRFAGRSPHIPHPDGGIQVDVQGMTCQNCVRRLESALNSEAKVQSATVQLNPGRVIVRGSIDEAVLKERIRETGFEPTHSQALTD